MRKSPAVLLVLLFVFDLARAEVRVQVIETDPPAPATLGHWEEFHLRIAYETDVPVRIRAFPYFSGKPVPGMTSGSLRHGPGKGEALFWIAYTKPAFVDRIIVRAEDDRTQKPIAQSEFPVNLVWTGQQRAVRRQKADWVVRIQAENDRIMKEEAREYASRPRPWWEPVLFFAATWAVPLYFIVQAVVLWRWRGGWRIAAAIPAVPMLAVLLHAIFAFFAGSNIFPLFLIFFCLPALIYLLILVMLRRLRRQPEHV
jgi:hypothetical protein